MKQTILGSNGQIAEELARELRKKYTTDLRLVSRKPKQINGDDELFAANLLDAQKTSEAVAGSAIVYLTVGLPMDTAMMEEQFPVMMQHVIAACKQHQAKLVFFDNTYMYAQNNIPQTEESAFEPVGRKGRVRAQVAQLLLNEINAKTLEAVICRAPEFYGPGKTQSITNTTIFEALKQHKKLRVFINDNVLRTLIWTPDASKATALIGNTASAYNQTWHLPCDDNRLTYKQFIEQIGLVYNKKITYTVLPKWLLILGGLFNSRAKEIQELLPRYATDNIFDSTKFKANFPQFRVTTYAEGIRLIAEEN